MTDRPTSIMKRRLNIALLAIFGIVIIYLIYSIFTVTVRDARKWQELANSQQLQSTIVKASRGAIYDSKSQVLAQSSTVYTVYADPVMLGTFLDKKDDIIKEYQEAIAEEKDAKKRVEYQEALDKCKTGKEVYEELVALLADELMVET